MSLTAQEKAQLSDPVEGDPPRLAEALLQARAGQYPAYQTALEKEVAADGKKRVRLQDAATFHEELTALLGHVVERITLGLDEAWLSEAGYAFRPPPDVSKLTTKEEMDAATRSATFVNNLLVLWNQPEERWARALVETFVFLMYGGPGVIYARPVRVPEPEPGKKAKELTPEEQGMYYSEPEVYESFPRIYPFALACQHLSTLAVLSRGKTAKDVTSGKSVGLSCNGGSATLPAFKKGRKFAKKGECDTTSCILGQAGPGDAVFFNFHGVDSTDQKPTLTDEDKLRGIKAPGTVHAGTVLRKWGTKLQYFDTGVLVSNGVPGAGEGGTTDHAWAVERLGQYGDTVGLGVLGDAPPNLGELAEKLSHARPIAVARLLVLDEKPRTFKTDKDATFTRKYRVRYASPLLHLWVDGLGIHLSKLIWSVKNPPTEGVRLAWWVSVPKGQWVEGFLPDSATSKKPADLLQSTHALDSLYDCNIVFGETDHKVTVYRRFERTTKKGAESGWTHNFATEGGLSNESMPWIALREKFMAGVADSKVPGMSADQWRARRDSWGVAYRVVDPAGLVGETFDGRVGVPFFEQGLPPAAPPPAPPST